MMYNSPLKTQPLDPAVLQTLEKKTEVLRPDAARGGVPATAPLVTPSVLPPDHMQSTPPPSGVPAQAISLTDGPTLSSEEATLLLNVSEKLGHLFKTDRANFAHVMRSLETVTASGQVDFSRLSSAQQDQLKALGLNAQNTHLVYQQLYQMLLPMQQGQTSNAFQTVQSSVSHFLSNVDLKQKTFSQIESQARDLSRVQGVVSSLAASSINSLLADQTAGVYDLAVSKITGQNFNLNSGMDYTLGHFVVLSQESPTTLQQVESILQKVQSDQSVSAPERQLLNKYGLNVNAQNKLETIERKPLSLQEVQQLESVAGSMKDPSEGYSRVLSASADVIRQSKKLEELGKRAYFESEQVQQTTQEVQSQNQNLQQTQQATNQINARLQAAQSEARQLQTAVQQAPVQPGATLDINPTLLAQWNVRVQQTAEQTVYLIGNRQVSQLEVMQHLGQKLAQQQQEIQRMSQELARKKSEALKATAHLAQTTQKLETQTDQLAQTRQEIQRETLKLQDLELIRLDVVRQETPHLKPEELQLVRATLEPQLAQTVADVRQFVQALDQTLEQTLQAAHSAIQTAAETQEQVQRDARRWEQTLAQADDLNRSLQQTLSQLNRQQKSTALPSTVKAMEEVQQPPPPHTYQSPSLLPEQFSSDSQQMRNKRREQQKAERFIQDSQLERRQLEAEEAEQREMERQNAKRSELDQALFRQELKRLQSRE
jgi:hypothetical protein